MKKLLSLDDLYNFYAQKNQSVTFSADKEGYNISVQVNGQFAVKESDDSEGLLYTTLHAFHDLSNRNHSYIKTEVLEERLKTMKDRPIMADIVEVEDKDGNTVKDFSGHSMEIVEEDGKEKVKYIESPVGHFINPEDFHLEWSDEYQRNFAVADAVIYEEYTDTCNILRRRGSVDCSVELVIRAMSYDNGNKCLSIDDFYVQGCTLLGDSVEPGMRGSNCQLKDFSEANNSVFSNLDAECNNKLIEVLEKLDNTLSSFNKDNNEEGGSGILKFEELLQKYGKTIEDITFDYENLTDEELEAKFAEEFGTEEVKDETSADETNDNDNATGDDETPSDGEDEPAEDNPVEGEDADDEGEEDDTIVDENACKKKKKCTIENSDGTTASFEISLDEQICALQDLVNLTYSESDNTYYGVKVYSDYVIMCDYWYGNAYKQSYTVDGENYSLTGDRVKVKATYVTEEEEAALEEMRSNYELIQNELKTYKEAETKAQKDEVFADESYAEFIDTEDFAALKADADKYSVEELRDKADLLFAKLVKASGSFSRTTNEDKHSTTVKVDFSSPVEDKQPYGTLFD